MTETIEQNDSKHKIYLAVPGVNVCWGTVMGVLRSTQNHIAYPYNGGCGFSGVEDFNILWTDAHNLYEQGRVTHFAMLHGDIYPAIDHFWLDVLLEEMDKHKAALVSAISPIKDHRGVTSSGICDLDDHWAPFKRFTLQEIHEELPETFDNVAAGYPDKPLLHNTGLWVCDLSNPAFHTVNERGELDLMFAFPTAAVRDKEGRWAHRRESEDWLFSRELWHRGVRNTYITRRIRLVHHGRQDFGNQEGWGTYRSGDEDTASKWRSASLEKPLAVVQLLEFELGPECNLSMKHKACPNRHQGRFELLDTSTELDDATIVNAAVTAYRDLGFTGMVGWIYYNEPLLQEERMFRLMARIKAEAPKARFILWTNGTLIPEDCDQYKQFSQIVVSGYNEASTRGKERLAAKGINCTFVENAQLDNRMDRVPPPEKEAPCLRPFVEFIFDAYGNTHLCCYDWRGEASFGNLMKDGIKKLATLWRETIKDIAGGKMNENAPEACRQCGHRWSQFQQHDAGIVQRCREYRKTLGVSA